MSQYCFAILPLRFIFKTIQRSFLYNVLRPLTISLKMPESYSLCNTLIYIEVLQNTQRLELECWLKIISKDRNTLFSHAFRPVLKFCVFICSTKNYPLLWST